MLLFSIAAVAADDGKTAACITQIHGTWKDGQGHVLVSGQSIPSGTRIRGATPGGRITVNFADGEAKVLKDTDEFVVSSASQVQPSGLIAAILAKWNQTREAINGMSRGATSLQPAVLKLQDGEVEFAPAIASLDSGDYTFELRPVKGPALRAKCHVGTASSVARVPGLQPGVFTLSVSSSEGDSFGSVTVLIALPKDYEAQARSFQAALQVTSQWPPDVSPGVVEKFLSMWLAEIADGPKS